MVGTTLVEIRDHIEALATEDGAYLVRCGRTGERPVPVSGLRFDGREAGEIAARAAEQYRTALRRYDPRVPHYDLIVCQDTGPLVSGQSQGGPALSSPGSGVSHTLSDPAVTGGRADSTRRQLVEFCHSTAAAVFEALSDGGYGCVETAVMGAYFDLAETVPDPDDLCLCLVESMATELDRRLTPAEQTEVLASAASRLSSAEATDRPVSAALSALEDRGLLRGYTRSPWPIELDDGTRSVVAQLSGYALAPRDGRLPVLPIVVEVYRHQPDWLPSSIRAVDLDEAWRITLVLAREVDPSGLATAPIEAEA